MVLEAGSDSIGHDSVCRSRDQSAHDDAMSIQQHRDLQPTVLAPRPAHSGQSVCPLPNHTVEVQVFLALRPVSRCIDTVYPRRTSLIATVQRIRKSGFPAATTLRTPQTIDRLAFV